MRFLVARKVGAPEVIFTLAGWNLREGESVTHLETRPPARRRRALARRIDTGNDDGDDRCDGDGSLPLRFADGQLEQYMKRPRRAAAILSGCCVCVAGGAYAGRVGVATRWQAVTQTWAVDLVPQRTHRAAAGAERPTRVSLLEAQLTALLGLEPRCRVRLRDMNALGHVRLDDTHGELVEALRRSSVGASMYILLLTGGQTEELLVRAFDVGVDSQRIWVQGLGFRR